MCVASAMTLERFQAFDFRVRGFVLRSDLGDAAINELMKDGAFSLDARDKNPTVDFAFDHSRHNRMPKHESRK